MRSGRRLLATVVAPVPFTLVSETADFIASSVLLLVFGVVEAGWTIRHILGELALDRESDGPLEVTDPVEANR